MKTPKIKNRFEVKCEANSEVAEMYLYGAVTSYSWYDEDTITAKNVKKSLQEITAKTIKVHVNTNGGDTFEGIAISNLLKQKEATIEIYVDGLAASAGSIIAMAGDKVYMPSNSMMMIHKASTYAYGNADELMKLVTDLNKIDISVKASYASKFVGTDEELTTLIADATWLTAQECLDLGFCDEIIDAIPEETPVEPQTNTKDTIVNKYKKEIKTEVAPVVEIEPATEEPANIDISNLLKAFSESFK